jgi:hypothetical protein
MITKILIILVIWLRSTSCCPDFMIELSNQDGVIGVFKPVRTSETVQELYNYLTEDQSYHGASFASKVGCSMIFIHEDPRSCDRSLVMVNDQRTYGGGGEATMEISGDFSKPTVKDDDSSNSDVDSTKDTYIYDSGAQTTAVSWSWDPGSTDGLGHSLGTHFYECITVSPNFISGISSWEWLETNAQGGYSYHSLSKTDTIDMCLFIFDPPIPHSQPYCDANPCRRFNFFCLIMWWLRCQVFGN